MYKIVQVVPALGWGGAQVFCVQLCNALVKKNGYDVTLISMYDHVPGKHLPLSMLDDRVNFISLGKRKNIDLRIFSRMYKKIKSLKPDVVHTHLHAVYYCLPAYLKLKYSYKKIHTLHNIAIKDAPWKGRKLLAYFFKKNIIEAVSISEEIYKSAVNEYGTCIKILIHNGAEQITASAAFKETVIKINSFKKNDATRVLLNVGRICRQKNQNLLLEVMNALRNENIIAIVLGNYTSKKMYDKLIAHKTGNIFFEGNVENVGDYLLCADAFVLTSLFEGLPVSLLEALSAGIVPICTAVGGVKDVVTKNIGFLSTSVTKNAYLNALKSYLEKDKQTINHLKTNAKELYIKKFSMELCASKYETLYHHK